MPSVDALEEAARSSGLETLRQASTSSISLHRLGFFFAGLSLHLASVDGRTTARLRHGSLPSWGVWLIILSCASPMLGLLAHRRDGEAVFALLFIGWATVPYLILLFAVGRVRDRLFHQASQRER